MNYAMSGGHKKTLEAAQIILEEGGNAVDAAIASYLVSFISEPCMASIGAGGFAMVNNQSEIKLIDFFCQTPIHKKSIDQQDFFPVTVDFGSTTEDFHVGKGSMAVPGAIAGIYKLHEIYGSIPMPHLMAPAIKWAKEGIKLDKFQAYDFGLLQDIFSLDPEMKPTFFRDDGGLKQEGDNIQMAHYADFLDALSYEGRDLFYKGEISKQVSRDCEVDGHLTRADFESYEAIIRSPLSFEFLGNQIHTTGFPSVGGMILTTGLNEFQEYIVDNHVSEKSLSHFQSLVSIFNGISLLDNDPRKLAQHLINRFGILSKIDASSNAKKWGGTSHFNIIDKNGMTVSLTTSIGEGSGYFIPGTDMQMNNMLGEEALMPNGFHNWETNQRLQSMMCPTIITNSSKKTKMSLGSGGAGRIPYALMQVIINSLYFKTNIPNATESPRLHLSEGRIECETGFNLSGLILPNVSLWDDPSLFFGGVNSIFKDGSNYKAYADKRRYGTEIY